MAANERPRPSTASSENSLSKPARGLRAWLNHPWIRGVFWSLASVVTLAIICLGVWIYRLDHNIRQRFAEKRFAPPIEFYSAAESVRVGQRFAPNYFANFFARKNYRLRDFNEPVRDGDYSIWTAEQCSSVINFSTLPGRTATQSDGAGSAAPTATPNPLYTGAARSDVIAPAPSSPSAEASPSLDVGHCVAFRNPSVDNLSEDAPTSPVSSPSPTQSAKTQSLQPSPPTSGEVSQNQTVGNPSSQAGSLSTPETALNAKTTETALTSASAKSDEVKIIVFSRENEVLGVYSGPSPKIVDSLDIEPELFASYFGDSPTLRTVVPLGAAPTMCLNALMAIEDSKFLEHTGVSFTGLVRALIANLRSARAAQGGSTITQQLVKNYFLNDRKTLGRKLTEIAMAFLVEQHATKDEILETYINLIYMGQNGPFQVRGFAAASNHYFGRNLSDLRLDQCALLAAVLNSPGLFNPFVHPEAALKRRNHVVERMRELNMISQDEATSAEAAPLPSKPQRDLTEPAPYFVQAVRHFIETENIDASEGLRVYTTLNLRAQEAAMQAVRSGVDRLETNYKLLQKLKTEKKKTLEAVLISADPATGGVQALVGGRGYTISQFNRATDSHRQVGSVMKPFVYLTALEHRQENGEPYTPVTLVKDEPTTHKFEGQTWTPRNYEGTYEGAVPMFYALKESLNAATVNLGMAVGIDNIIDTARRMGVTSPLRPLPSLTLGAFELTPMEVLEAYSSIARLGNHTNLTLVKSVQDLNGKELYSFRQNTSQVVAPETTAELVGMMKQTLLSGTARGARSAGFTNPAAGKTGTTNDKKDAWFVGFTPYHAALVWVGYDDNVSHGLTGASGAVPIWTNYMKSYSSFAPHDFVWPEASERVSLSTETLLGLGVPEKHDQPPEPTELIFVKGQVPPALQR